MAENNLGTESHEQEKAALTLNKAAIGYLETARAAETDRDLYASVLRQIKETNLKKDAQTTAVSIIEHSPVPRFPVSPSIPESIIFGLLGGLAVGLVCIYVSNVLDRSIKTVDQAETLLSLPVLSPVPEVRPGDPSGNKNSGKAPPTAAPYPPPAAAPEG